MTINGDTKPSFAVLGKDKGFPEERNVTVSFFWAPFWEFFEESDVSNVLEADPPPIVMNMGLYVIYVEFS